MIRYFVEFRMDDDSDWICTQELSCEDAVELEAKFHAIGWKARAFRMQQSKTFIN